MGYVAATNMHGSYTHNITTAKTKLEVEPNAALYVRLTLAKLSKKPPQKVTILFGSSNWHRTCMCRHKCKMVTRFPVPALNSWDMQKREMGDNERLMSKSLPMNIWGGEVCLIHDHPVKASCLYHHLIWRFRLRLLDFYFFLNIFLEGGRGISTALLSKDYFQSSILTFLSQDCKPYHQVVQHFILFFHSIVQICLSCVPSFPLWHAWKEQFASQIAFCAMDSRARGLHLTWLSSVARPTNCLCDWRTDLWISPAFPVGCPGSPQSWLRMLTARLHHDGRDLSLSDRCSGSPSPGPRWWQIVGLVGVGWLTSPSNHTESTRKHTLSIRPPDVLGKHA